LAEHLTRDGQGESVSVTVQRDEESDFLGDPVELVTAFLGTVTGALELAGALAGWRMLRAGARRGSNGIRVEMDGETVTLEELVERLRRTAETADERGDTPSDR
jgi:hypothetical protein